MLFSKTLICAIMGVIPKVVASPINLENGLLARDDKSPILAPFWKGQLEFLYVEIKVGSQKIPVNVTWDTGSYMTWVPNTNVTCDDGTNMCKIGGLFDPLQSTTYVDLGKHWGASYIGSGGEVGWVGTDKVSIGEPNDEGATATNFEFAVTYQADGEGCLGMAMNNNSDPNYLPTKFKAQGHITKAAFSYWHNSTLSYTGSFLLGGLDEAKYEGELIAVPRMKSEGGMKIYLASIVVDGQPLAQGHPVPVDTGAPYMFLPNATLQSIATKLGGSIDSWDGVNYFIPCDQDDKTIDFVFGEHGENAKVSVPLSEFLGSPSGSAHGLCPINIYKGDFYIIGVPVQKYAHWVFDQDEDTISIAKPTYSSAFKIVAL